LRRTKIVCTLGPASDDFEVQRRMVRAGMDVARINVSHGTREQHIRLIRSVREAARAEGRAIAVMLDMKGPELRIGKFADGKVMLVEGSLINLTSENIIGTPERITVNYDRLAEDLRVGDTVLLDDGLMTLEVVRVEKGSVACRVINGGELSDHKGVNLPGAELSLPSMTEADYDDVLMAIQEEVDFIAISFVRKAQDVVEVRDFLEKHGVNSIQLIAKIETKTGLRNFDDILETVDAVMVARGDLGVEVLPEEVPLIQKSLIKKCNLYGKAVITATHMLDSMVRNPRPTRAEASDVANAIFDGTDAIMLSGETAIGKFPVQSVETMARIAVRTEKALDYREILRNKQTENPRTVTDAISHASCTIAMDLKADAILTPTVSGSTARRVSRYRPKAPIIALSSVQKTLAHLCLTWGVLPVTVPKAQGTDEMFHIGIETCLEKKLIAPGDLVVFTAGVPIGVPGKTNLLRVYAVEEG